MKCVKCGAELHGEESECSECGVILSKARVKPLPAEPVRRFHYLVAPFHGHLRAGQGIEQVSAQLQGLIDHYASHGWELVQFGSVSLTVDEGCIAGLLGNRTSQRVYDQLVFRRPVE